MWKKYKKNQNKEVKRVKIYKDLFFNRNLYLLLIFYSNLFKKCSLHNIFLRKQYIWKFSNMQQFSKNDTCETACRRNNLDPYIGLIREYISKTLRRKNNNFLSKVTVHRRLSSIGIPSKGSIPLSQLGSIWKLFF